MVFGPRCGGSWGGGGGTFAADLCELVPKVHAGMACLLTPAPRIPAVICFMLKVFGEGERLPSGLFRGGGWGIEKWTELRSVFQAKVFQVGK